MEEDEQLLRQTDEEPEAFGRFYARHERAVLGFFMRRVRDPELAEDLCAETFAAALVSRKRFRSDRGTPTAWLFGIANHQLQSWTRRRVVEDRARRRLGIDPFDLSDHQLRTIAALEDEISDEAILLELPAEQATSVCKANTARRAPGNSSGSARTSEMIIPLSTQRPSSYRRSRVGRPFAARTIRSSKWRRRRETATELRSKLKLTRTAPRVPDGALRPPGGSLRRAVEVRGW